MDYCEMAQEEGLLKVTANNPGDWVDDARTERPVKGIDMASVLENQCVTYNEIIEALDAERWQK